MRPDESDATPQIDELFRRRLMESSGGDRVRMACDMFDTAVTLIVASIPPEVAATAVGRRLAVMERLYWAEWNDPFIVASVAALRAGAHGPPRSDSAVAQTAATSK